MKSQMREIIVGYGLTSVQEFDVGGPVAPGIWRHSKGQDDF